jgi:hypothetical protein
MRVSMTARDPRTKGLDKYLDVELTKSQCRLRSFAMGGLPSFESTHSMTVAATKQLVEDIIAGRLSPQVLELFEGLEMQGVKTLRCFVTDRRQPITAESSVTLALGNAAEPAFKVHHAHSTSHTTDLGDLLPARV